MEALSEVLALLKPRTSVVHGLHAGGDWSLQFPAYDGVKFNALLRGSCWLTVQGEPEAIPLSEGDGFLLTRGLPFSLSSDPTLPSIPFQEALHYDERGVAWCRAGGDSCHLVGGRFAFSGDYVSTLFGALPAVVPVHANSPEAAVLRWALDQFAREIQHQQPGAALTVEHLTHLMLIQVLRLYLTSAGAAGASGWLYTLADPQLGAAVNAIHTDLRRRWTVDDLARIAGMSRSTFAEKFRRVVGKAPLDYLTGWRMHVAADRLRCAETTVSIVAAEVGYDSEAAFSTAFKRTRGQSPRAHRGIHIAAPPPVHEADRPTL